MRSVPSDSVYTKTAKGIREVEEGRVKLPRDLEVVFALVDGRSSAAELLPRSDIPALKLYQALDLLVADGYIKLVADNGERTTAPEGTPQLDAAPPQQESDTAERVRQLNERAQASRGARERSEREARRVLTEFGTPAYEGREIGPVQSPESAEVHVERGGPEARPQHAPTSLERAMSRLADHGEASVTETQPLREASRSAVLAHALEGPARLRHQAEAAQANLDAAARGPNTPTEHDRQRARRLARRHRFKRALAAVGFAAVLIPAAVIAWLQFMPLDHYVPAVQRALSERLRQPVTVGAVRYQFLPRPRLVLDNVMLAKGSGVRAERIESHLMPWDALGRLRHVELVEAHGVEMDPGALAAFSAWMGPNLTGTLQMDRLRLVAAKLNLPNANLGAFDGDITFGPDGAAEEALFTNAHVRLELKPMAEGVRFVFNAREWRMPYGPPVEFTELVADGLVDRTRSAKARFNGRAGGGAVAGSLSARWPNPVSITGHFAIEQGRIHDLADGLMKNVGVRGTLNTTGRFSTEAEDWAALPGKSQVNAQFSIARGELTNVDLLRALQSTSGGAIRGGRTAFEKLSGVVRISDGHYSYRELQFVSGPLNAIGLIDVSGDGELSGRISTELGSKAGIVARSVLVLAGTLQDPQVKR